MRWLKNGLPVPALLYHYRNEGEVIVDTAHQLDPEGLACDIAVVTLPGTLGLVRMRLLGGTVWTPVTDDLATTFRHDQTSGNPFGVEVETTVPAGDPREILLKPIWDLGVDLGWGEGAWGEGGWGG